MPRDWLYVELADRWGGDPDTWRAKDAGRLRYWLSLLSVEAHVQHDRRGADPGETVMCYEWSDEVDADPEVMG